MANVTKCPKCEAGLMYPSGVHVHAVDDMMVRGCIRKCAHCEHVAIITEAYERVSNVKKRATRQVAKIGL